MAQSECPRARPSSTMRARATRPSRAVSFAPGVEARRRRRQRSRSLPLRAAGRKEAVQLSERRSRRGLAWMALAQLFFALMNVCTRLGSAHLPWSEIAAARFVIGALIAVGLATAQGHSLRVTGRAGTW